MEAQIAKPREDVSQYAPKMSTFSINPDKIKDVIGKGGETITKIIQDCSGVESVNDPRAVKIEIEDDGRVMIYHMDREVINKAEQMIRDLTKEVIKGELYNAKVVKIEKFGCFVQVWPGCEGLVHISQLAKDHVEKVEDVVSLGDEIVVKSLGTDEKGRLNFSRKDAME